MINFTKLALGAAALVFLAGPASAQDACATTTDGTIKLAAYPSVRAFYDALTTGNPDLVDCAVSATWTNNPSTPDTPAGPDGFKPSVGGIHMVFAQYSFETQDVIVEGDKIVVRSLVTAEQSAPFLGVPAGGTPVQFQTIDIHQLGPDGKLEKSWHVEDWLSFLFARGALPLAAQS
ncbi:MAG: ester cyclase [Devosia sp.]